MKKDIRLAVDAPVPADAVADLFRRSTIKRPFDDRPRIQTMIDHANLTVTAWHGDQLVGIARALTDFAYCCYLSDLAVDAAYQRQGIGRALIAAVRAQLDERVMLLLLAAPEADDYYGPAGFTRHPRAWFIPRER